VVLSILVTDFDPKIILSQKFVEPKICLTKKHLAMLLPIWQYCWLSGNAAGYLAMLLAIWHC